jgi:hypothetical protein
LFIGHCEQLTPLRGRQSRKNSFAASAAKQSPDDRSQAREIASLRSQRRMNQFFVDLSPRSGVSCSQ